MLIDKIKIYPHSMKNFLQKSTELLSFLWDKFGQLLTNLVPKGLYARALIIIIAPIVLLMSVLTFVFMERHWESVTKRLSTATSRDISMLVSLYDTLPRTQETRDNIIRLAGQKLDLSAQFLPLGDLPKKGPKPFFRLLDKALSSELGRRIDYPFWLDTVGNSNYVEIRIKLDDTILHILARRSQTFASNSHIFLVWMLCTSLVLLTVAILFLRNQIKPILRLAQAAKSFGMGRPVPKDFRPRGAREVREAAYAFLDMRDRIERHVEQRTTMLAGVSHDLRTILTRFKLQLALLEETSETNAMSSDIKEMQNMLEDYMSFAKGDNGEKTVETEINELLEDVCSDAELMGANIAFTPLPDMNFIPLRRNAFKRAVMNLVTNAIRYGDQIEVRAKLRAHWLYIFVEDNGPGIPHDKREDVFRPFYRIDSSRNQDHGNTGLGLSIASDITHAHGGNITLHESQLGGLKVVLRIPV